MTRAHDLMLDYLTWHKIGDAKKRDRAFEAIYEEVKADTVDGFDLYYQFRRGMIMPRHVRAWADEFYGIGGSRLCNVAFRGATKTTWAETFQEYQIGLHPERSNLLVQASDDSAEQFASNVADTIAKMPEWKLFFPHVVPDEEKGWGAKGYYVRVQGAPDWERKRHKDPTMLGASYKAAVVVGKHPTGVFNMDDINDDKNTESDRESAKTNRIVTDTLFPMTEGTRHKIFSQTPWTRKDALALVRQTGIWHVIETPVMSIVPEGAPGAQWIEIKDADGFVHFADWAILTWPEKFNRDLIEEKYREVGARGFARMYMLSLKQAEGAVLKAGWLHKMPNDHINQTWPVFMGIDYAEITTADIGKDPDYLSITFARQLPNGRLVIIDGFRGHLDQGQAEQKVKFFAHLYGQYLVAIGVEMDGSGRSFYSTLVRQTDLPLYPSFTRGKSKEHRIEKIMAPYFEFRRVWIAEDETEWLRAFKDEWLNWPNSEHDDTLDSTFHCLAAAGVLFEQTQADARQEPYSYGAWSEKRKREDKNMWVELSKHG